MAKKGRRKAKGKGKSTGGGVKSPGVYLDEVPGGGTPIEGVGTSIPAFVGFAEKGPGVIWRRTGVVVVLVTGAAAGVWAWRHRGELDRTQPARALDNIQPISCMLGA